MSCNTGEVVSSLISSQSCHHFSLAQIQSATNDFDAKLVIGEGGFGKVYKGYIHTEEDPSHVVAIKRLDPMSNQGATEFRAEIEMLSKLRHCHLVSLIGFCDDNKEMILVYEYMPHGTLDHHLHEADTPLSWVQRLKIALGAARGLDYLHTGVGTEQGVIHRDIKTSNILLDKNWAAMISDFGLSKLGPTNQSNPKFDISVSVKGTFGYLDPEYFYMKRVTRKTDVFAFGVVLFELLSGRRAVDMRYGEEECYLVRWAQKCVKDRKLYQLVDNNIRGTIFAKCLTRFAQIAYRCLHSVPKERPSMTEVVASLQFLLELQEKHDNSAESSRKMGFTWKIHKYLVPTIKQNSDQSGTIKKDGNDHGEMPLDQPGDLKKKDGNDHGEMPLDQPGDLKKKDGNDLGEMPLDQPGDLKKKDSNDHGEMPLDQPGDLKKKDGNGYGEMPLDQLGGLKKFTYVELECATRNFAYTCRGVERVFKGWVDKTTYSPSNDDTGLPIAVKRFGLYEFVEGHLPKANWLDLNVLKEVGDHPNLVKLIGCCLRFKEVFLVYEFMPNGNLEDCIDTGTIRYLSLEIKVKILVGVARGMVFLEKKRLEMVGMVNDETRRINDESWFDRHKAFLDEDLKDYVGVGSDDYEHFNPWSCNRPIQLQKDDIWGKTIDEYRLQRRKIILDKDYTAKLLNHNGIDNYGYEDYGCDDLGDYYPGHKEPKPIYPVELESDLSGFTVLFTEVIIGRNIRDGLLIDDFLRRRGKESFGVIAKLCFEICNEEDSESRMLTILEDYDDYIHEINYSFFYKRT